MSRNFTILSLMEEARYRVEGGDLAAALWRLVDATGLCAEGLGWPTGVEGIQWTGRGFAIVRDSAPLPVASSDCPKCINSKCSCD